MGNELPILLFCPALAVWPERCGYLKKQHVKACPLGQIYAINGKFQAKKPARGRDFLRRPGASLGGRWCRAGPNRTAGKMAIPLRATGYSSGVSGEPRMSETCRGCQSSGRPNFMGREWTENTHPGQPRIGASRGGIRQRYRAPGRRVPLNPTQPSKLIRRGASRNGTCG